MEVLEPRFWLAIAAFVPTVAMSARMPVGADLAAIVFAIFLNCAVVGRNDAKTRFTGAFHLSCSSHDVTLLKVNFIVTCEQMFRYRRFIQWIAQFSKPTIQVMRTGTASRNRLRR